MNRRSVLSVLALPAVPALAAAPARWDLPSAYGAGNFHVRNLMRFATEVERASGGTLEIRVHPDATRFKAPEIKSAVQRGQVPAGEVFLSNHQQESAVFGIDAVPFLARSYRDAMNLYRAQRPLLEARLRTEGLMLLYSEPWPPQGLYSRKPLQSAADMRGLRWRVYSSVTSRLAELLGARPVAVQASELRQALAQGRIDAYMSSASTGVDSRTWEQLGIWYDVQAALPKNAVLVRHAAFADLDTDTQEAVLEAAAQAETRGWADSERDNERSIQGLREHGMQITQPTASLRDDLEKAGQRLLREWLARAGADGRRLIEIYRA